MVMGVATRHGISNYDSENISTCLEVRYWGVGRGRGNPSDNGPHTAAILNNCT